MSARLQRPVSSRFRSPRRGAGARRSIRCFMEPFVLKIVRTPGAQSPTIHSTWGLRDAPRRHLRRGERDRAPSQAYAIGVHGVSPGTSTDCRRHLGRARGADHPFPSFHRPARFGSAAVVGGHSRRQVEADGIMLAKTSRTACSRFAPMTAHTRRRRRFSSGRAGAVGADAAHFQQRPQFTHGARSRLRPQECRSSSHSTAAGADESGVHQRVQRSESDRPGTARSQRPTKRSPGVSGTANIQTTGRDHETAAIGHHLSTARRCLFALMDFR